MLITNLSNPNQNGLAISITIQPMAAMMHVFIYGGGMSQFPAALAIFLRGIHQAFLVSFVLSVVAMIVAALRPDHRPQQETVRL